MKKEIIDHGFYLAMKWFRLMTNSDKSNLKDGNKYLNIIDCNTRSGKSVSEDIIKKYNIIKNTINPNDNINDFLFIYVDILDSGTYGTIVIYKNINDNYILVKYEEFNIQEYPYDLERGGYFNLIKNDIKLCNIISSLYIGSYIYNVNRDDHIYVGYNVFIMPYMTGDLSSLLTKTYTDRFTDKDLAKLFIKILDQLICLFNNDLYYWDIKLKNILYICPNKDNISTFKIMFGDIGSLNNESGVTYAIWPYNYSQDRPDVKLLYNKYKDDKTQLSKYLSYLFILTIICKNIKEDILNIMYPVSNVNYEKRYSSFIKKFLSYEDRIPLNPKEKIIIKYHNDIFIDASQIKSTFKEIIESAIIHINKDPAKVQINDLYKNLIPLDELHRKLSIIANS